MDATKEKLLTVASKIFSRFGFHKTTMDEIARIARKAKGSLYYYFSNKEDLFREVVTGEINILRNELQPLVDDPEISADTKLRDYLTKRMEILKSANNYHDTLKADFYEHFDFIDEVRADWEQWEKDNLRKIIVQGTDEGIFVSGQNLEVLLDVLIMVLKGLEIPFFLQNKYDDLSPYFDDLLNILVKGLSK